MESNRDEADRCIEIALKAFSTGDLERSEKFLKKAENLYPTDRAKEILSRVRTFKTTSSPKGPRRRKPDENPTPSAGHPESPKRTVDYTPEQLEMVRRIKKCRDFYEVLGVKKEATDSEIKKAYKKMALQLHPDKNKAPGAAESFKAVGNAVATLTDPEKRKAYDLYGNQENTPGRSHYHHHHRNQNTNSYDYGYSRGFESDMTAEELFNIFFGGGFPQGGNTAQNRQRRYQQQRNTEGNQQPSLAFGLILVLVVVSLMSSFFTSDPIYSLAQHSKYPVKRKTTHFAIPYYVKENFETEYQGSIERLENSVEEEYITSMKQSCYRERNYREAMLARARTFGSKLQIQQAQNLKTPACDNLYRLEQMIIN